LDESVILYDLNAAVSFENYYQVYSLIIAIETLSKIFHMNSQGRQPVHRQTDKPLESDLKKRKSALVRPAFKRVLYFQTVI